jgi:vascular endothelial growth factor C/D
MKSMSGPFCLLAPMNVIPVVIDEEWQRTQCSPRETCVEVASELGKTTNTFFKPPCVNVFRCGGCCNEEGVMCMNTSTSYISKQVREMKMLSLTLLPSTKYFMC